MESGTKVEGTGYCVAIHVSALLFFFLTVFSVPFLNIIVPLVLWLLKKDNPFVDFHGREAVRFQVFLTLYALLFVAVIFMTFGFAVIFAIPFVIVFYVAEIVFPIVAAIKSANGEEYCYPLTFSPRKK